MADFPVYQFNESLRGAPQLPGQAGSLISVIDACVITGFGSVSVTSIVVADGVATCTVNSGESFEPHHIIEIDGATPSALNGRHRVLPGAVLTQFEFATTASDGSATGTITAKYAAAEGWEKVYSGSNKAVYRATTGNRSYYRIDDDFTQNYVAEIRGYEEMSDVDTGTAPFPLTRTSVLEKSYQANGTARYWDLFTDGKAIMFGAQQRPTVGSEHYATPCRMWGDMIPLSPSGDPWCSAVLSGENVSISAVPGYGGSPFYSRRDVSATYSASFARGIDGIGSAVYFNCVAALGGDDTISGYDPRLGTGPSAVSGKIYLSPVYGCEGAAGDARAIIPGVWYVPQTGIRDLFGVRSALVPEAGPLAGRRLIAFSSYGSSSSSSNSSNSSSGRYFIDATGPWRD